MMKSPLFRIASSTVFLAIAVLLSGCSESSEGAKVRGQVTLDGSPLSSGVILFEDSVSGTGGSAIVENGIFAISTPMPVGKYTVALQPPPPPAPHEDASKRTNVKLPRHLTQPATSGLEAELTPGENDLDFNVDSK